MFSLIPWKDFNLALPCSSKFSPFASTEDSNLHGVAPADFESTAQDHDEGDDCDQDGQDGAHGILEIMRPCSC